MILSQDFRIFLLILCCPEHHKFLNNLFTFLKVCFYMYYMYFMTR